MIKAFWYKSNNFGDCLSEVVLSHFLKQPVELSLRMSKGKLMAIGSIMTALRENDIVWGSGCIRPVMINVPAGVEFLAVRGPLTREFVQSKAPEVYGDPAILMPLIYKPVIEKKYELGIIPHYVDKIAAKAEFEAMASDKVVLIDVQQPWQVVIDQILACDMVVSSSLHGIIVAEAYGIPVVWTKFTNDIIGGDFKFQDYFLGTGRTEQDKETILPPLQSTKDKQQILLDALYKKYGQF